MKTSLPRKTPTVLIYRDDLLGYSETFIADQASALRRFNPIFVGIRSIDGLDIPHPKFTLARKGWLGSLDKLRIKSIRPPKHSLQNLTGFGAVLIHAHFLVDAATALHFSKGLNIPLIVSVHGYDATVSDEHLLRMGRAERVYLRRRKMIMNGATHFLCVSNFLRTQLLKKGFPEEKLSVHYTGVDTVFFSPDSAVERSRNVLFVGRLVKKKGCEQLIRAMALVQKRVPEATLTIIGDGPLRPQLQLLASSLLRSCLFLGSQPRDVVRKWMNASMVFSVPSVVATSGDAEGFGMVFAEAQSMGLPVASFSTGGIPEAVAHGETGLLATEGDHRELADNIAALLTDAGLWNHMSSKARERVQTQFDLKKQTIRLEQIYSRFVDPMHSAAALAPVIDFAAMQAKGVS
jgi:colanic acid/amylovoran biosynthesis glycosyltransferase